MSRQAGPCSLTICKRTLSAPKPSAFTLLSSKTRSSCKTIWLGEDFHYRRLHQTGAEGQCHLLSQFCAGRMISRIVFSGAPGSAGIGARFASFWQSGLANVGKEAFISLLALLLIRGTQFASHSIEQSVG